MINRLITIVLLTGLLGTPAFAQDDEEFERRDRNRDQIKSIFSKDTRISGFGAFDIKLTEIKGETTLLTGGHGGVLLNKNIIIGGGGYGIATDNSFTGVNPATTLNVYGGYGGLLIGGIIKPREIVHITIPVLIGAGGVEITDRNFFLGFADNEQTIESSAFFVVEPGIQIELNVTRFFRIGLGGSYRFVEGIDLVNFRDGDMIGYNGEISFSFGGF